MVLSHAVAQRNHILISEGVEADVQVHQREVLHERLAPLPRGHSALKLVDRVSLIHLNFLLLLEVVLEDRSLDCARAERIERDVKDFDRSVCLDRLGEVHGSLSSYLVPV